MADLMQYDVVSPERRVASGEASELLIPGTEGNLTAMPEHAATITTLRPGILRVVTPAGTSEYLVTGGFAEITATGTSVLAEHALERESVTKAFIDELVAEATSERERASARTLDAANKRLADLADVAAQLGLNG